MSTRRVILVCLLAGLSVAGCSAATPSPPGGGDTTSPAQQSPGGTATDTVAPAPTSPDRSASSASGIKGLTVVDGCPVVTDPPCPAKPVAARFSVDDGAGGVITTIQSGNDGQFTVALRPGRYVLHLQNVVGGVSRPSDPVTVTVRADQFTTVTLRFDSGMR